MLLALLECVSFTTNEKRYSSEIKSHYPDCMEVVDDEESQQSSEEEGYEEINEDDGKSSEEDPTPKNRKRRPIESYPRKRVTEACIPCKERHLKCDSKQSCLPCSKRKVPCIYAPLEIRKKRGRKPGIFIKFWIHTFQFHLRTQKKKLFLNQIQCKR